MTLTICILFYASVFSTETIGVECNKGNPVGLSAYFIYCNKWENKGDKDMFCRWEEKDPTTYYFRFYGVH